MSLNVAEGHFEYVIWSNEYLDWADWQEAFDGEFDHCSDEEKYRLMAQIQSEGHVIGFDVLYNASSTARHDIDEEIGYMEGVFLRKYRPVLNTQIPKEEDWHQYGTQTIDAKAVLENLL